MWYTYLIFVDGVYMKQNKMMKDVSKIFTKAKKSFADKLFEFLFAVLYL